MNTYIMTFEDGSERVQEADFWTVEMPDCLIFWESGKPSEKILGIPWSILDAKNGVSKMRQELVAPQTGDLVIVCEGYGTVVVVDVTLADGWIKCKDEAGKIYLAFTPNLEIRTQIGDGHTTWRFKPGTEILDPLK